MNTLPLRAMGQLLREMRGDRTQLAASRVLEISKQGVGRLERGLPIKVTTADLNSLMDFYKADNERRDKVLALWSEAREAKAQRGSQRGWWKAYADTYGSYLDQYLSLEESANKLTTFQLTLLPGLLQTPGYRRSIVQAVYRDISLVELERRVELMVRRQQRLTDSADLRMDVVLSEIALRMPVGGPDIMAEQMDALVKAGQLPNVTIRVVPASVIGYPGLVIGSFTMCEFPLVEGLTLPAVVYAEGHEGALFLDEREDIVRYQSSMQEIQPVALSAQRSRELILEIAESLR